MDQKTACTAADEYMKKNHGASSVKSWAYMHRLTYSKEYFNAKSNFIVLVCVAPDVKPGFAVFKQAEVIELNE